MATRFLVPAAALLMASGAWAEGLQVEPGLWEMNSTVTHPMMPQPQANTTTECLDKSEITMDDMSQEGMDPNCTFEMSELTGDKMKWSMDCPLEGGQARGEWEATSTGNTVSGGGVMTMTMQGQTMEMTMSWEGRRTGPCP